MRVVLTTVDRWLIRRFFTAFLVFLFAGILLFLLIDIPVNLSRLQRRGLGRSIPLRYGTMLPELFFLAAPHLTLLSALWVTATLRRTNELQALFTLGFSSRRVSWSLVLAALLVVPFTWANRELLLPRLAGLRNEAATLNSAGGWILARPVRDSDGGILMPVAYRFGTHQMREVYYVELNKGGGGRLSVYAERGDYVPATADAPGRWLLSRGVTVQHAPEGGVDTVAAFGSNGYALQTTVVPSDLEASQAPAYVSARELRARLERTPSFLHLEVELYQRYSQPLGGLALLLVALPLVIGYRETGSGGAVVIRYVACLGLSIGYFVFSTLAAELGARGAILPWLAAALPPVSLGLLGGLLFLRVKV